MAVTGQLAGVKLTHVPYRGAQAAYQDILGGRVDLFFDISSTARSQVDSGTVRALAVSSEERQPMHPDVPSVYESGVAPLEMESWFGLFAPAATPPQILERLRAELAKVVAMPEVIETVQEDRRDGIEAVAGGNRSSDQARCRTLDEALEGCRHYGRMTGLSADDEHKSMYPEPLRSGQRALRVEGLRKGFKGGFFLRNVSLVLFPGEVVGLLGPTGAGKTTTLQIILGRMRPNSGVIWLNGRNVTHLGLRRVLRRGLDYAPKPWLGRPPLGLTFLRVQSAGECVLRAVKPSGLTTRERRQRARELLQEFGLWDLRHTSSAALSGTERRRLELAIAVASRPSFILLDEPFAGIDPLAQSDIEALVRNLAATDCGVLFSGDNVRDLLPLTTRSYMMHNGRIVAHGRPDELVR